MEKIKQLESIPKTKCDEEKKDRQSKEKLRHEKEKEKEKRRKQYATKLMKLIPITKNTNMSQIFFEAWPIFRPPLS